MLYSWYFSTFFNRNRIEIFFIDISELPNGKFLIWNLSVSYSLVAESRCNEQLVVSPTLPHAFKLSIAAAANCIKTNLKLTEHRPTGPYKITHFNIFGERNVFFFLMQN